jgi:menaquinone-dependent protoporphyrinogen oxidase
MTRVLVAYATAHGSTREIAERIAARLTGSGLRTVCTSVTEVDDVHGYDAFVVGSAIHNQAWLPEAIRFVRHHARVLGARPTWLFSVGMPAAVAPALRGWAAREGPKVLESMRTRVHPNGERLFSGVVRRDQFPVAGRLVFWLLGGRYGDFRDNEEIDGWAEDVARQLTADRTRTGSPALGGPDQPMTPVGPHLRAALRIAVVVLCLAVLVLLLHEFFINL